MELYWDNEQSSLQKQYLLFRQEHELEKCVQNASQLEIPIPLLDNQFISMPMSNLMVYLKESCVVLSVVLG